MKRATAGSRAPALHVTHLFGPQQLETLTNAQLVDGDVGHEDIDLDSDVALTLLVRPLF